MTDKICSNVNCNTINPQPYSNFSKNKNTKDGYACYCKKCFRERNLKNAEHIRNKSKEYYNSNLDLNREKRKNYNREHSDQIKETAKQWFLNNREYVRQERQEYYLKNKEDFHKRSKKWVDENRMEFRKIQRNYKKQLRKSNPGYLTAINGKYRAAKLQATPKWADLKKIEEIYKEAKQIQKETGIIMHVDHQIPLQHELVCGLHVESNLQILSIYDNCSKNNFFEII